MPLKRLQESGKNSKIKGLSNRYVSVAQLDRAQASDAWCRWFESNRVHQKGHPFSGVFFACFWLLETTKYRWFVRGV